MTTSQRLLDAAKDIWERYYTHPFILGIESGTLPREKFRYYILQDYLYLIEYAKAFGIGIAKSTCPETTALFSGNIALLTGSEMNIHHGYMGRFAVTQEELDATPRALDNLSYTSYMLRVAYEEGEAEILTAILACAWSYERIAKCMAARSPHCVDHDFYGEWIRGYLDPGYSDSNVVLINTLDRLTARYTDAQLAHLADIFVACSRYELRFWDLSWSMSL